jgi:hypothetical protein
MTGDIDKEIWEPVPGYTEYYAVSSWGRVKRIDNLARRKDGVLKVQYNDGYTRISFNIKGESKGFYVHYLVALAFIGPRPNGLVINHKDGIRDNNRVENLEYVTQSRNVKHAYEIGLSVHKRGEDWCKTKLTDQQVEDIRFMCDFGVKQRYVASVFGVTPATVNDIFKRRSRKTPTA